MQCFEINLFLYDHAGKQTIDLRQYFQQEKGSYQAILDTLTWIHLQMKKIRAKGPNFVIERLIIWSWNIATPSSNGEILTKKSQERVLNWAYEQGIISIQQSLSNKRKRRVIDFIKFLNKYRHMRSEVIIEEISSELTEDVTFITI